MKLILIAVQTFIILLQPTGAGFLTKIDDLGNFKWAVQLDFLQYDSNQVSYGYENISIDVDDNNNIYVMGKFIGTQDFDPGPNEFFMTSEGYDFFILKLGDPITLTDSKYLLVSTNAATIGDEANSTKTFSITSLNTNWTISSSEPWLTIGTLSGTGDATILLTAQRNSSISLRTATVTIKATGLPDKTIIITQTGSPTGIYDTENNRVRIYPNPANTVLFIDGITQETQVSIYNLQGNLLIRSQLVEDNLDIDRLVPGIYIIKMENKLEVVT